MTKKPNIVELCQDFDENRKEAERVASLPEAIFEAVKAGDSSGDPIRDFTILRNGSYSPKLAAKYAELEELVKTNTGASVAVRTEHRSQFRYPHQGPGWNYDSGLADTRVQLRAGVIKAGELSVGHIGSITPRGGVVTFDTGGNHYQWSGIAFEKHNKGEKIRTGMPLVDYYNGYVKNPAASALLGTLYAQAEWGHRWRPGDLQSRSVLDVAVVIGDFDPAKAGKLQYKLFAGSSSPLHILGNALAAANA